MVSSNRPLLGLFVDARFADAVDLKGVHFMFGVETMPAGKRFGSVRSEVSY